MRAFLFGCLFLLLLVALSAPTKADLYVASFDSGQILRFQEKSGVFMGTFAKALPFDHPLAMAVGGDGNFYVGVNNFGPHRTTMRWFIRRFHGTTGASMGTFVSGGEGEGIGDLDFGPDGNLYVSVNKAQGSKISRYNGRTGRYLNDFVAAGSGELSVAEGFAFGPDGNLYVTSRGNSRILRYDGSTGAFKGIFATGGNNGPIDLAFGPDGNLYVLTSESHRGTILRFNGRTGAPMGVFVNTFEGPADGSALLFGPKGDLYVTTGFTGNSVQRLDRRSGELVELLKEKKNHGLSYATGLLLYSAEKDRGRHHKPKK